MTLAPGQIIDGKYRILRRLAEGGMGAVFQGENTRIGRKVAIKVLHASLAHRGIEVERFEREAQLAARIGSEHIIDVLDMGDLPDGNSYMVMEYLEGESLGTLLARQKRLSPERASALLVQTLDGLARAHEAQVIHRDLKPDNLFIVPRGSSDLVKILDFGVSKLLSDQQPRRSDEGGLTLSGTLIGTPAYMSPEQARGRVVDARADIYALGVIMYECVAGFPPFDNENVQELLIQVATEEAPALELLDPKLDPDFLAIVRKAMARDLAQRFQTADEFRASLVAWREARGLDPNGFGAAPPPQIPAFLALTMPPQASSAAAVASPTVTGWYAVNKTPLARPVARPAGSALRRVVPALGVVAALGLAAVGALSVLRSSPSPSARPLAATPPVTSSAPVVVASAPSAPPAASSARALTAVTSLPSVPPAPPVPKVERTEPKRAAPAPAPRPSVHPAPRPAASVAPRAADPDARPLGLDTSSAASEALATTPAVPPPVVRAPAPAPSRE